MVHRGCAPTCDPMPRSGALVTALDQLRRLDRLEGFWADLKEELRAVAITLPIVLVENLRRLAERLVQTRLRSLRSDSAVLALGKPIPLDVR
jgi:hypothetical protein